MSSQTFRSASSPHERSDMRGATNAPRMSVCSSGYAYHESDFSDFPILKSILAIDDGAIGVGV